ncbi:uncharacterized protein LOC117116836 [Anneissia japonica]|uniref:uncharacterized protein LOC117116836 n=1 Tax=Anneissia japonica TaxID=1529436 RepID=UPI0014255608|nr:uncharacterized protein LOC117116836 [Anneissia japonica]
MAKQNNDDQIEEAILAAVNNAKDSGLNDEDVNIVNDYFTSFFGDKEDDVDDDDEEEEEEESDEYDENGNEENDENIDPNVGQPTSDILTADDVPLMVLKEFNHDDWDNPQTEAECHKIRAFNGCKCKNGQPCTQLFDVVFILQRRMEMCELSSAERKLFIMGHISTSINRGTMTQCTKRRRQSLRKQTSCTYWIEGNRVCRTSFEFIHCISSNQMSGILKHYKANGATAPVKNSGGRKYGKNGISFGDTKHVATFITNFGERHGMMLPGKTMGVRGTDAKIRLLPTSVSKASLFRKYTAQMDEVNRRRHVAGHGPLRVAKRTTFEKIWKDHCPFIKVTKPKTDLCWQCQRNNSAVYPSANSSLAQKTESLARQLSQLLSEERGRRKRNS